MFKVKVEEVFNDKAQIDHWNSQLSIVPSRRTLLMEDTISRDVFRSPQVSVMKNYMNYTSTDGQLHHQLTKSELEELTKITIKKSKKKMICIMIKKPMTLLKELLRGKLQVYKN